MMYLLNALRLVTGATSVRNVSGLLKRNLSSEVTRRTCLYDFHVRHGGKMVPFAGWEMPVQYKDSISESHLNVRANAGIFDVSHMLQTKVSGKDQVEFMESLTVSDVQKLKERQAVLSLFTNEQGGILDDLIITKTEEGYLFVVSNAGCAEQDYKLMQTKAEEMKKDGYDIKVETICNALIALQGPAMPKVLQPGVDFDLKTMPFMTSRMAKVFGIPYCRVSRCGYTGEDGVEISVTSDRVEELVTALLKSSTLGVRLAGLGARDSLRLEAGLCLYGNDIDTTTNPVEASLLWLIGQRRREAENFPGASKILAEIEHKPRRKRVGFLSTGPPARAGTEIYDETGKKVIGKVTSGCPSPSLKQNVAMGYVESTFIKTGTKVKFEIRKKMVDATVAKMPFVPSNYYYLK